jgi:hypothetical protein
MGYYIFEEELYISEEEALSIIKDKIDMTLMENMVVA